MAQRQLKKLKLAVVIRREKDKLSSRIFSILLLFVGCGSIVNQLQAQQDSTAKSLQTIGISGTPLLFYLPETRLGFGAAGIYTFRFKEENANTRPSQIQVGGAYTLNRQILSYLTHQFYLDNERWNIKGELGYYRYSYDFFGVGNENPPDFIENYGVTFPRIRYDLLYGINRNFYLGLRYWFDGYDVTDLDPEGQLISGEVAGGTGGNVSALGLVNNIDTRDDIFFPTRGVFIEAVAYFNREALGSDFNFTRYTFDVATYFPTVKQSVLAANLYAGRITGIAPFNELLFLGGRQKARGYYEGRFRDDSILLLQAEWRSPLFWRFRITCFGSYGSVAPTFQDLELANFRYNYGVGLRFKLLKASNLNIRIDAGFGQDTSEFYFTFGEAF